MTGSWGVANSQHRVAKDNDLKAASNILTLFRVLTSMRMEKVTQNDGGAI
jgi:hypothetical protein